MTLFYHDVALLYRPGDKKTQEIEWEQWNNAVYRHGHTVSTQKSHGASAFGHGPLRRSESVQSRFNRCTCGGARLTKKKRDSWATFGAHKLDYCSPLYTLRLPHPITEGGGVNIAAGTHVFRLTPRETI